jgi:single-strand DNA-binding protein
MAGSLNKVCLLGNLGKDPEIRSTQTGSRCANLSIATSESWRDKNSGERQERTEWHRVTVWVDGLVDVVDKYLKKGSKVYLEGRLETRKWTDNSGQERYTTEFVLRPFSSSLILLGDPKGGDRNGGSSYGGGAPGGSSGGYGGGRGGPPPKDLDDEIPF